jgi:hypothetical protein
MPRNARTWPSLLLGVPLLVTGIGVGYLSAAASTASAVPRTAVTADLSPWSTLWQDDFNGTGRLSDDWIYRTGTSVPGGPANFGTGEIEVNTDSTQNVYQGGGVLNIKALRGAGGGWTSGRIESRRGDLRPPAGGVLAVEARMQLPNLTGAAALGYWPAFWMLGTPYRSDPWSWPRVGEIDIMENVQGLNTQYATMHCGTAPGGECNEFDGLSANTPGGSPSLQSAMHTYRMEWDESTPLQEIRWYLDGRLFHTVRQDRVSAATWAAATDHGYYIVLNLAMGGQFPAKLGGGPVASTVSGGALVIDRVTVRSRSALTPAPVVPTATCTTTPATPSASTTPTPSPTTTSGTTVSARSTIAAASYSAQSGVSVASGTGGSAYVTGAANGDWLRYDRVDFGPTGAGVFKASAASGIAGGASGLVEVRLDSPTGRVLGSFAIANTGGWQSWRTIATNTLMPAGVHPVYLTFTSGQSATFANLASFSFS